MAKNDDGRIPIIITLSLFSIFLLTMFVIDSFTGRSYEDGIKRAEMHYLTTGKFYNKYKIIGKDSAITYIKLEKQSDFNEIYWDFPGYEEIK